MSTPTYVASGPAGPLGDDVSGVVGAEEDDALLTGVAGADLFEDLAGQTQTLRQHVLVGVAAVLVQHGRPAQVVQRRPEGRHHGAGLGLGLRPHVAHAPSQHQPLQLRLEQPDHGHGWVASTQPLHKPIFLLKRGSI